MSRATWYIGDALKVLRTLPSGSVDLVLTSPPFLALRSYLPADHPDKDIELGQGGTPGEFVDGLMLVVEECRRVLAPHGSLAIELGDTFASSGDGWPLPKSLSLIPETVRFTMVYGRNPHTGRETEPWRLRNVVRWCRPNPTVGGLGDKYRPATTDIAIFAQDTKRFFDLDAVRDRGSVERNAGRSTDISTSASRGSDTGQRQTWDAPNPAGAPPLDYWEIPIQPYKGAHYATWPRRLLDVPIRSMVPQRVCRVCGRPSERITERTPEYAAARKAIGDFNQRNRDRSEGVSGSRSVLVKAAGKDVTTAENVTVGWSDCGHDDWRNGIVLDPFAGSGTTLEVATGLGRDAIGIDLDERNYDLAVQRVGMFLELAEVLE